MKKERWFQTTVKSENKIKQCNMKERTAESEHSIVRNVLLKNCIYLEPGRKEVSNY